MSAFNFGSFEDAYSTYQPETEQPNVVNYAPFPSEQFYIVYTQGRN